MNSDLEKIRRVADYQFGKGVGAHLFPANVVLTYSRRTGRIRYVHLGGKRLATLRPVDGLFSLSLTGAERIAEIADLAQCFVTVRDDVAKFIVDGGDVFAVHVVEVDNDVRSKDEVIVVNERGRILAVGRALLSSEEMKVFKRGVAVKVRHGRKGRRLTIFTS